MTLAWTTNHKESGIVYSNIPGKAKASNSLILNTRPHNVVLVTQQSFVCGNISDYTFCGILCLLWDFKSR